MTELRGVSNAGARCHKHRGTEQLGDLSEQRDGSCDGSRARRWGQSLQPGQAGSQQGQPGSPAESRKEKRRLLPVDVPAVRGQLWSHTTPRHTELCCLREKGCTATQLPAGTAAAPGSGMWVLGWSVLSPATRAQSPSPKAAAPLALHSTGEVGHQTTAF